MKTWKKVSIGAGVVTSAALFITFFGAEAVATGVVMTATTVGRAMHKHAKNQQSPNNRRWWARHDKDYKKYQNC